MRTAMLGRTPPNGMPGCLNGACGIAGCHAPWADCDHVAANGCERNLGNDLANCGVCGVACAAESHATPACKSGLCGIAACDAGYADCDGIATSGCEVNLDTDPLNCQQCGHACDTAAFATSTCTAGVCGIACLPGRANCNGSFADGCEVDLQTNTRNCGTCGTVCPTVPNGGPGCAAGVCGVGPCNNGWADCNQLVADGRG